MMTSGVERAAPPPGGEGGRRGPPVIMGTGGPSDRGGISSVEGGRGGGGDGGDGGESNHHAVAGLGLRASVPVLLRAGGRGGPGGPGEGGGPGGSVPMSSVWTSGPSAVVRVATLSVLLPRVTPPGGGGGGGGPPLVYLSEVPPAVVGQSCRFVPRPAPESARASRRRCPACEQPQTRRCPTSAD